MLLRAMMAGESGSRGGGQMAPSPSPRQPLWPCVLQAKGQAEQGLPVPTRREGTPAGLTTHRGEAVPDPHALTPPREPIPRGCVWSRPPRTCNQRLAGLSHTSGHFP